MKLAEADDLEPQRIDALLRELMHDARGARSRQFPVGRKCSGVNRPIVGVALDADRIRKRLQDLRQLVEHRLGRGRETRPRRSGNRMSVLISISSHMFSRRTVTSLASISACIASCTCTLHADQGTGQIRSASPSSVGSRKAPSACPSCLILINTVGVIPDERLVAALAGFLVADVDRPHALGRAVERPRSWNPTAREICPR